MPVINVLGESVYYRQNHSLKTELKTLLFIHGAGGNGGHWLNQLTGISGVNLIAPDLPGHGRSEGSALDSIGAYSKFIWHFTQVLNLRNVIPVGHSMGGAIALDLALTYPELCKGLIIVDSGAKLGVNPGLLEQLTKGEQPLNLIKFCYSDKISPDLYEKADREMRTVASKVFLADFQACNKFNAVGRIQNIHLPALIICGQEDQMTPPKYSEYLRENLSQSSLAYIADAGHMTMLEQPDQVNEAINRFLKLTFAGTGASQSDL